MEYYISSAVVASPVPSDSTGSWNHDKASIHTTVLIVRLKDGHSSTEKLLVTTDNAWLLDYRYP